MEENRKENASARGCVLCVLCVCVSRLTFDLTFDVKRSFRVPCVCVCAKRIHLLLMLYIIIYIYIYIRAMSDGLCFLSNSNLRT